MSARTAFLGKLLGFYCVVISLAMFAHGQGTVEMMKSIAQNSTMLFMAGLMGATAGLAIVLNHDVWRGGALPVMVTLFGWAALIKGILLLVLSPETESRIFIVGLGYEQYPYVFAGALFLLGSYMAYRGFSAKILVGTR